MKTDNKKPLVSGRTQGANKNTVTKNNTIMNELVTRPLNRFQAEEIGDHCLPSTISSLKTLYGLEFPRRRINVPNRFGGETSVMEYRTSDDDKIKIREIQGAMNG
jgi:hypothetical protein